jgi:hypothetical protein
MTMSAEPAACASPAAIATNKADNAKFASARTGDRREEGQSFMAHLSFQSRRQIGDMEMKRRHATVRVTPVQ